MTLTRRCFLGSFATAPGLAATEPFKIRGYYTIFSRNQEFGLDQWRRVMDAFAEDRVNLLLLWIGGAFRSRKFPITWQYNQRHPNVRQDFARALIDHAHTRGIRVLLGLTPFAYDGVNQYPIEHPKLKATGQDGRPVPLKGIHSWGYNLCPSRSESMRFMLDYTRELCFDFYPNADGLFLESSDYAVCHCDKCGDHYYDREYAFVTRIAEEVWRANKNANVMIYPQYFSKVRFADLKVASRTGGVDPRFSLFFARPELVDRDLISKVRSAVYWDELVRHDVPTIRESCRQSVRYGVSGYVPSLEINANFIEHPEWFSYQKVGETIRALDCRWCLPEENPIDDPMTFVTRFAFREFSLDPELSLDGFRARLATRLRLPDESYAALLIELHSVVQKDRQFASIGLIAYPEKLKQRVAAGKAPADQYRKILERLTEMRATLAKAPPNDTLTRTRRAVDWILSQWDSSSRSWLYQGSPKQVVIP